MNPDFLDIYIYIYTHTQLCIPYPGLYNKTQSLYNAIRWKLKPG